MPETGKSGKFPKRIGKLGPDLAGGGRPLMEGEWPEKRLVKGSGQVVFRSKIFTLYKVGPLPKHLSGKAEACSLYGLLWQGGGVPGDSCLRGVQVP